MDILIFNLQVSAKLCWIQNGQALTGMLNIGDAIWTGDGSNYTEILLWIEWRGSRFDWKVAWVWNIKKIYVRI